MVRKIIEQLVDDLDGTVLDPGDGQTVRFGLDGRAYEIDLTDEHATALRARLAPYVSAARGVRAPERARPRVFRSPRDRAIVRAWAREHGYTVTNRGPVPAAVLAAYNAAR